MTSDARAPQRVILATNEDVSRFALITRGDIKRVEDLKGKRIGFSSVGAITHYSFLMLAERMGWNPRMDVSFFGNGAGPRELKDKRIDVYAASVIARFEAKKDGLHEIGSFLPYNFAMPGSGVNADKAWLPKNRDTAARFVKATIEAVALIKTDKAVTVNAMKKWYGITDPALLETIYEEVDALPAKPYPAAEGLRNMIRVYDYREMRLHKAEDFYDASFVEALDKAGYIDGLYAKTTR
jgi:NitT/TauT family transport system substrate-binding protein